MNLPLILSPYTLLLLLPPTFISSRTFAVSLLHYVNVLNPQSLLYSQEILSDPLAHTDVP